MGKKFIVRADIPKEPAIVIKDQPIVTPGVYYGVNLSEDSIKEHIRLTDWSNQYNKALIYGHKTNTKDKWVGNPSPEEWVGYYTVPEYKTEGVPKPGAYSDIYVYDQSFASKLAYGGVRCGVSATFDNHNGGFRNLSIIDNPKCKDAFLNLSDDDDAKIVDVAPNFLNLNDDVSDLPKNERGKNSNIKMNNDDEKSTERIAELEKQLEAIKAQLSKKDEPSTQTKPVEPAPVAAPAEPNEGTKPVIPVEPAPQSAPNPAPVEPAKPAPVAAPASQTPVEITGDKGKEDGSVVVDAIEKMADKVTEQLKKAAAPQSVAPTDPAKQDNSRDDEVTQSLVDKYESLHGLE